MEAPSSMVNRLREAALAGGRANDANKSVVEFVDVLKEPFTTLERGKEWHLECEGLLQEARALLDPSVPSGKDLLDRAGVDLPKVAILYVEVSKDCQDGATCLIESLATAFDPPREMFTAFFEVINMYSKPQTLHVCFPLLRGLCLVFPRIKRRTTEFFKEAVIGLVEVGRSAGQDEMDMTIDSPEGINRDSLYPDRDHLEDNIHLKVICELIRFAKVIKEVCEDGQEVVRLRDLLGIYTLQLLSVTCGAVSDSDDTAMDEILDLMGLLSFCKIPLISLVSDDVDIKIAEVVFDEEDTKAQQNRLEAKRGAALAVYWGIQTKAAAKGTSEAAILKQSFQKPGRQMVLDVIGLASNLLAHVSCTQEVSVMCKGLSLMTHVLESYSASPKNNDVSQQDAVLDLSIQIRPALQRLQDVIVYVPSPMLRRQAYGILIMVVREVLPSEARFETLRDLISSSIHPSLVSLLLTCVKDEVLTCWPLNEGKEEIGQDVSLKVTSSSSPFASPEVLQFIELVLRTKDGTPAELPTNMDAVLGALNLYRFLLIRESSGNTNYTHVLSREELVKGRTYWLLPLREQIFRVQSALETTGAGTCEDIQMALDSLQSVQYRCLEIVEQLSAKLPH